MMFVTNQTHFCATRLKEHSKEQLPNRFNLQLVPVDDMFLFKNVVYVPHFDSSVYGRSYYLKKSIHYKIRCLKSCN